MVYGDVVYRDMIHGDVVFGHMAHREIVHRDIVYRDMVYGDIAPGGGDGGSLELMVYREGSRRPEAPPDRRYVRTEAGNILTALRTLGRRFPSLTSVRAEAVAFSTFPGR
ncbi:hypothetical protein EYF80_018096 [Liparis tanakae]|uniref:Uncharacterized protein n=1 Tax=Liparis tanakae TaxID=230148 RepID=A0A4Z2I2P8_9TELE|nr:hypothetical protein EYF80_018096 [Liparis tanakae]